LREAYPQIQAQGARALAVATGAGFQAAQLMRDGLPFPALCDPDKNLYRALGIDRIRWHQWVRPGTWRRYVAALGGQRQGRLTGDILQAPGVVILDASGTVRYLHRGRTLADYPSLAEILDAVRTATGPSPPLTRG
jgi:hypothetical protein